jgi:hypothetical protein
LPVLPSAFTMVVLACADELSTGCFLLLLLLQQQA